MFDFSWSEILVIGIVALVVIGPKELPGVMRTMGQWMGKVRRMASEFQSQFQDAMREAELADIKKEVENMATQATAMDYSLFDPKEAARKDTKDAENAQREIETALAGTPAADAQTSASSAAASTAAVEATPAAPEPHGEAAVAEPAASHENVPVAPGDEPKPADEHAAGGSGRG